jgi:hypothetical protein
MQPLLPFEDNPPTAPLVGLLIRMQRTIDVPCSVCGETDVVIGLGAGPHAASLHCASCSRHRGWLPKLVRDFLAEVVRLHGWPTDPITIHSSDYEAAPPGASAAGE